MFRFSTLPLLFLLAVACSTAPTVRSNAAPSASEFRCATLLCRLDLPDGWNHSETVNGLADVSFTDSKGATYLMILSERRTDFEDNHTLESYGEIVRNILSENLVDVDIGEPIATKLGELRAQQTKVAGTVDLIRVVYLHTVVESPTHYFQIVGWTTPSKWEEQISTLAAITDSFVVDGSNPSSLLDLDGLSGQMRQAVCAHDLCTLEIPIEWDPADLNPDAGLQVGGRDAWLLVLSESKENFDTSIDIKAHSNITRGVMSKALEQYVENGPQFLTIADQMAVRYEIAGHVSGIHIKYLHTTIDGEGYLHQVIAFTGRSTWERYKPLFEKIVSSFRDTSLARPEASQATLIRVRP
jgi:hypothetical protein